MNRYKSVIAYDGSGFSGYQIQPNGRTVQGELEAALQKLHKGANVKVSASGRTDAGVHAIGQVIHFDSPLEIPEDKWPTALNGLLPNDISLQKTEKVHPDFHARFSAVGKEYRYKIYTSSYRSPFKHMYECHYPYALDLDAIKAAIPSLLGTHDFTSFCSAKTEVEDKIRTIRSIELIQKHDELEFIFKGNGFLYNMVRILTGTLLEVGTGKKRASDMEWILSQKNRIYAGKTAPAEGLYLWKVYYSSSNEVVM
jgi:tRNA pseudouridine38-40 synthase